MGRRGPRFGDELNKAFLISLLNSLLPEYLRISDLEFGNPEFKGRTEAHRGAIFDLYCIGVDGTRFVVELQRIRQEFSRDRCLFYSTFPIQEQSLRGDWNYELAPVYVVAIVDFAIDRLSTGEKNDYVSFVQLKDQYNMVFTEKYMQLYVELPRFRKSEAELLTDEDKWLYFLRHAGNLSARPERLSGKMFDDVFDQAKLTLLRAEEHDVYQRELKEARDLVNQFRTA